MPPSSPEYPALHGDADRASASAQRRFQLGVRGHLGLLVLVGLAACAPAGRVWAAVTTAVLMALALVVHLVGLRARLDARWFECRALAENVKSAAWLYALGVAPERRNDTAAEDVDFVARLDKIRARLRGIDADLAAAGDDGAVGRQVTPWMRKMRGAPIDERVAVLTKYRIDQQRAWYASRARDNARQARAWEVATMVVEVAAIMLAIAQVAVLLPFSPAAPLGTVAAALVAWTQTKRFSDLATTYRVAAEDLSLLREMAEHAKDEAGLRDIAERVEDAISREHSVWYRMGARG